MVEAWGECPAFSLVKLSFVKKGLGGAERRKYEIRVEEGF